MRLSYIEYLFINFDIIISKSKENLKYFLLPTVIEHNKYEIKKLNIDYTNEEEFMISFSVYNINPSYAIGSFNMGNKIDIEEFFSIFINERIQIIENREEEIIKLLQ